MSELRKAAQAAPDAEVRAQHKKFARWFLELSDKSALASEYLAWLAWKAALAHPPRDEWREAAEEALRWMEHARLHLTIKERMHPDGLGLYDNAAEALRTALAQPESRPCTCHPDDNPPQPCAQRYALTECKALAQPEAEAATGDDLRVYDAIAANYVNAEPKAESEPVAWQVRWIDPEEGPGAWRCCLDPSEADYYANREDHDWRQLYAHPPRDEWRPASDPPEDGRDVVVWCAQERRAVHGMYVRRHPPVVGLVDGWVAPDASKLTHWRDVTPPTEGAK